MSNSNVSSTTFVRQPAKGALFAKADRETGELVKISGEYTTKEGVIVFLIAEMMDGGALALTGTVKDHPKTTVEGMLCPEGYNADYKSGFLTVGKMRIKLNSKSLNDRTGQPYRFVWEHSNTTRVAC